MTKLDTLEAALAVATPGPWRWEHARLHRVVDNPDALSDYYGTYNVLDTVGGVPIFGKDEDKDFIALAVNSLPALIAVARAAQGLKEDFLKTLLHGDEEHRNWLIMATAQVFEPLDAALAALEKP